MFIVAVGLNHKRAPVEIREKLAFAISHIPRLLEILKATRKIDGCVILSTCNRTEIYATSKDVDSALSEICKLLATTSGMEIEELQNYLYKFSCRQAVAHLFRVAAGLDSMVLGENEILGQVKEAYQIALENSASNSVMNLLFQKALSVGKQVRTETRISCGAVSVGYAAVELAKQVFGDIKRCSVLIIGAGEIGELVARNLACNSASEVIVCNRSYVRAVELASKFNGRPIPFDELFEYISLADIVVTCTAAPHYIITKEHLASIIKIRGGKQIFLIDLAVPRNIEPESNQLEEVHLYNIDDLQKTVDESLEERKVEAAKAEKFIEGAVDNFLKWLNSSFAVPIIRALRERGTRIKDAELERAVKKLGDPTEREREILHSMANSIVNKLLHTPIIQLKKYAETEQGHLYAQTLRNLFELPVEMDEVDENEGDCNRD